MQSNIKQINDWETLKCPDNFHFIESKDSQPDDYCFYPNEREWIIAKENAGRLNFHFCRKNTKTISAMTSLNSAYKNKQILYKGQICKIDHIYIQNYVHKDDIDILVGFFEPKSQGYGIEKLQNCIFVES
jgi:hypothetical protein